MKTLELQEMEQVEGGLKCIYHGLGLAASLCFGLAGLAINALVDGGNIAECWNNGH